MTSHLASPTAKVVRPHTFLQLRFFDFAGAQAEATPELAQRHVSIAEYGTSENVDPLLQQMAEHDLFSHAVELEAYGMTVVPPEKLAWKPDFAERLMAAIVRTCEQRNDVVIGDPLTSEIRDPEGKLGANSWDLIEEDPSFVEAATNPVALTLIRWLCGQSVVYGGATWIIKRPSKPAADDQPLAMALHSDSHGLPPGSGNIAHMCNASILCTDYVSGEDGPTVFVPGSHKFGRATLPHETFTVGDDSGFKTFPLIAKAGSLALWNGAVWHGSLPRTKPGLRVTLVQTYFRTYMRPVMLYDRQLSQDFLDANPELAEVVGAPTADSPGRNLYPYEQTPNSGGGRDTWKGDERRTPGFMNTGRDPYA